MKREVGPEKAKILRARRRLDPEEQYDQQEFQEKFKDDPFTALQKIEEKQRKSDRNIEKQVSYFGHVIEPFNMKSEKEMGTLDSEGFFVFNKKKGEVRDAWLDSLQIGNEEQLLQGIQKKIIETKKALPVNQVSQLADQEDSEENASDSDEEAEEFVYEREKPVKKIKRDDASKPPPEQQPQMLPCEIKYLLSQLLPSKLHCSSYLKQLKPTPKPAFKKNVRKSAMLSEQPKPNSTDLQQHEKILQLCHQYIKQTGDHGIMTKTKEELMKEIEAEEKRAAGIQDGPTVDHGKKDEDDVF